MRSTDVLPSGRILIHQPSGGFQGEASDIEIHARETIDRVISSHEPTRMRPGFAPRGGDDVSWRVRTGVVVEVGLTALALHLALPPMPAVAPRPAGGTAAGAAAPAGTAPAALRLTASVGISPARAPAAGSAPGGRGG